MPANLLDGLRGVSEVSFGRLHLLQPGQHGPNQGRGRMHELRTRDAGQSLASPAGRRWPAGGAGPGDSSMLGQRLERRLRGGVGQIVAWFAAIQVLAVEDPTLRARPALGRRRPLGAEAVGAGALRALRHGHLLPRSPGCAPRPCAAVPAAVWGCGGGHGPDREGRSRSVSVATRSGH